MSWRRTIPPLVGVAALALLTPALGDFWLFVLALTIIYALASLSLVVLTGWSGQLNLHVAALGLGWGAYSVFALSSFGVPTFWALLLAGIVTVPFAAAVAAVAVRFRGLELAVATLAIGLIFERLAFRNIGKALSQRSNSISTPFESSFVPMDRPSLFGVDLDSDRAFFLFSLAIAVVLFLLVANVSRSGVGRTLRALREREIMAETLGIPVVRYRIGAFVLSILLAATAGGLFAALKLGIAPDSFNINLSFNLLAATVIGGIGSIGGAVIGGVLAALLPEVVQSGPLAIFSGERLFLVFGLGMVVALWRLPEGLAGIGARLRRRARAAPPSEAAGVDTTLPAPGLVPHTNGELAEVEVERRIYGSRLDRHARPTLLRTDGIRIAFGGVQALGGVDISIPQGEICALIGPNGAGKSTLFNCISGLLPPDEGRVYFDGADVTELSTHRRAARGVARTFQTVEAFRNLTVEGNLMVAGHLTRSAGAFAEALALPAARRSDRALRDRARRVISTLGLDAVADRRAGELPLGLLRVLEFGMALVPRPRLLLLDEPSAGLDANETASLADLVARARTAYGLSVLLVEHDMSMVSSLAEHVYVLDFGRIIAQGTPEQVRTDPIVIERYLGQIEGMFEDVGGGRRARR
ncbi:MAG TPA: branched-chain amino acid ABC transporter ATP-binding protein/permease [Actinomycetota bacterium]